MIHDAEVEVTCDSEGGCTQSVRVGLRAGANNVYLANDRAIELNVEREHGWIVIDGKHYCCEECKP